MSTLFKTVPTARFSPVLKQSCVFSFAVLWSVVAIANSDPIVLPIVEVGVVPNMGMPLSGGQVSDSALTQSRVSSSDSAALFSSLPGVDFASGGGVASLPVVHGLADDRIKYLVDGIPMGASCPNHMNPALSYIDPTAVAQARLYAGITPVSMGGDSIAGTMVVDSAPPLFADPGAPGVRRGNVSSFYRSNGNSFGGSVGATAANSAVSLGYTAAWAQAQDQADGHGNTLTSTYYQRLNQMLTLGVQGEQGLFTLAVGHQTTPREGFTNQPMDMTGNQSDSFSARYQSDYAWGRVDSQLYWQDVTHQMDVGDDKARFPDPMFMPMKTHSKVLGYSLKAEIHGSERDTFRIGNEYRHTTLDDWWPPVPESDSMGPNMFSNINGGRRDQFGLYAEWESHWNPMWSSLFGVRSDVIRSNTGQVQGYYSTGDDYAADANAFNAQDHFRQDNNFDLTALTRFTPNANNSYEMGYARKSQSPSLYQRYAWSKNSMASSMVNWYGDGNAYVGNLDLKPEVAHTMSATADWHDADREQPRWQFKATPYYSYVQNYIDVDYVTTLDSSSSLLQFANHDARLYGLDLSGLLELWNNAADGRGMLVANLGWMRGERVDTGNSLYHMMPLNARVTLEQRKLHWTHALELRLVNRKTAVDSTRDEPLTPGYGLVNLRTAYQVNKNMSLNMGVSNLFNTYYSLPLGGVNVDQRMQSKWMQPYMALAGAGRSFDFGASIQF